MSNGCLRLRRCFAGYDAVFFVFVLMWGSGHASAQESRNNGADPVVVMRGALEKVNLSGHIALLTDAPETATLDEVLSPELARRFRPHYRPAVNLGLRTKPVWVRATVMNQGEAADFVLEVDNSRLAAAALFIPEAGGGYQDRAMGTQYPLSHRDYLYPSPAFKIHLAANSTTTFYIKIRHAGGLRFWINLWEEKAFGRYLRLWALMVFMAEGMLLALALQGLCLFAGVRERSYLWYAVLMFAFCIVHMASYGTAHLFLWPNAHYWADHSISFLAMLLLGASLIFSDALLNGPQNAPMLSRAVRILAVLCVITAGACLIFDHVAKFYIAHFLGLAGPALTIAMGFQALWRGYRPARIFLMAWGAMVAGSAVLVLLGMGLLPSVFWTEHLIDVSLFAGVFLWSFSLTDRLKTQEEEIQKLLLSTVRERTDALNKALVDVKKLHGLLPICSACKKIRDDRGYWQNLESYISEHSEADFSHSLCPSCLERLYPQYFPRGGREVSEENNPALSED